MLSRYTILALLAILLVLGFLAGSLNLSQAEQEETELVSHSQSLLSSELNLPLAEADQTYEQSGRLKWSYMDQ